MWPCVIRIRSALTVLTSSLPVGFDGFAIHGSIRIVLPLGRSISNAAWPNHFTFVLLSAEAVAVSAINAHRISSFFMRGRVAENDKGPSTGPSGRIKLGEKNCFSRACWPSDDG